jgi:Uma2 family endonuclease
METINVEKSTAIKEQRFVLPGCYNWQQFKTIQSLMGKQPGVKISYLDGVIELMTLGEEHEIIKSIIGFLIESYLFHKEIEFIPVGSATRESEEKAVSFEPDESYYIGEKKEHPDLAIEVNITSGTVKKLKKYQRFRIKEVWIWKNNNFSIYSLQDNEYERISKSELLPDLDFKLLQRCVLIPSKLQAIKTFTNSLKLRTQ